MSESDDAGSNEQEREHRHSSGDSTEDRWSATFDAITDIVAIISKDHEILEINATGCAALGRPREQIIGRKCFEIVHGSEAPIAACPCVRVGRTLRPETALHDENGRTYELSAWPQVGPGGEVESFVHVVKDVTDRRIQTEERERSLGRQRAVAQLQRTLLAPLPLSDLLSGITESIVDIFDADFCRIWLIRPGDLCDLGCVHNIDTEDPHACCDHNSCLHLVASSGRYTHVDGEVHRRVPFGCYKIGEIAAGEEHRLLSNEVATDPRIHDRDWAAELGLVSFAGYRLRVPRGEPLGVLALFSKHPITGEDDALLDGISSAAGQAIQRAASETGIQQSQSRWQATFDAITDTILLLSLDHEILDINAAGCEAVGLPKEAVVGKKCFEIAHGTDAPISVCPCRVSIDEARSAQTSFEQGGRHMHLAAWPQIGPSGAVEGVVHVVRDITEEVEAEQKSSALEEQLRIVQKLEAIGRLAGGVAHDFNNMLSVIISFTGLAIDDLREDDPICKDLDEVLKASRRAAALTRQLLAFSRNQVLELKVFNINDAIRNVERMLVRLIGEDVELGLYLAEDLGNIEADPGQVDQIVMNLAVNARDAMPGGGTLTIETVNVALDEKKASDFTGVTPGKYALMTITDTGVGMDAPTRSRVFEPFFTTKEKGKGTGLGLATVYGIVTQSGGGIRVRSEPGQGTTFMVYLPRVDASPTKTDSAVPSGQRPNTETILVVEDEDAVRRLAERILRGAGYEVLTASNGGEAFLLCEERSDPIDLLVTDVVMPRMSGRQVANRLSRIFPTMKILYMSGYTDDAIVHHGVLDGHMHFLTKPFSRSELTRKVREVLDSLPEQ